MAFGAMLSCAAGPIRDQEKDMSTFERYLTVWVALCIMAGIGLGYVFPSFFQAIGSAEMRM
jgi:ACR3 family arsenite efflux pump ArsB